MKTLNQFIKENIISEGFFNSLFGTGTDVKVFVKKIRIGIETLKNEDKKSVFSKLEPSLFVYDEKQKNIIYKGEVDSATGIYQNKPIFKNIKISSHLSDKEMKELANTFGKTPLGQEIFKYSDEFKKDLEQKKKQQENDPKYQGQQLAELVADYYNNEIWKNKNKQQEYINSMSKLINKFRDSSNKFDKSYEENIKFSAKHSSKLNSNLNDCDTIKKLNLIIGEYLNKK